MADETTDEGMEPAAAAEAPTPEAPPAEAKPKRTRAPKAKAPADETAPVEETAPVAEAETVEDAAPEVPAEPEAVAEAPAPKTRKAPAKAAKKVTKKKEPAPKKERGTYVRTPAEPSQPGRRKERRGVVVSSKEDKTITVRVDVMMAHPKYKKIMRRSVKLRAHDEQNTAGLGDVVRVVECRPLSKSKRWRLVEIVEVAQ